MQIHDKVKQDQIPKAVLVNANIENSNSGQMKHYVIEVYGDSYELKTDTD